MYIGVRMFRIFGGPRFRYWGGGKGRGQIRRHVPIRFLINQCQIITVLILNSDIVEN